MLMPDRRRSAGWALFFGLITVLVAAHAVTIHSVTELIIALVVSGLPFAFFGSWAVRRRPALVIDPNALTDGRSGRVVPWANVRTLHVGIRRGLFGEGHHLVLTLANSGSARRQFIATNANNSDEVDINLDLLSVRRDEVVNLVERASGQTVTRVHDRR